MANTFDNQVILEAFEGAVIFQDLPTATPLARIVFAAGNPNGLISGEIGSLCLSPVGLWENTDGATAWTVLGAGGVPASINTTLCRVAVSVVPVGLLRNVTFTVTNFDGTPVITPKRLIVFLYQTSGAGDNDLAGTAIWNGVVPAGTLVSGSATNRAVGTTTAAGVLTLQAADPAAGVPPVFATSMSSGVPTVAGAGTFAIAQADEGAVFP